MTFLKKDVELVAERLLEMPRQSALGLVFVPLTIPFMEAAFGEASEAQTVFCLASGTRAVFSNLVS